VLKLLDQLYYRVLEALFPTRLRARPTINFHSTIASPLGKLGLNARGFNVWETAQQYQQFDGEESFLR